MTLNTPVREQVVRAGLCVHRAVLFADRSARISSIHSQFEETLFPRFQASLYSQWGDVRLLYARRHPKAVKFRQLRMFYSYIYDILYIELTAHLLYNIHLVGLTI